MEALRSEAVPHHHTFREFVCFECCHGNRWLLFFALFILLAAFGCLTSSGTNLLIMTFFPAVTALGLNFILIRLHFCSPYYRGRFLEEEVVERVCRANRLRLMGDELGLGTEMSEKMRGHFSGSGRWFSCIVFVGRLSVNLTRISRSLIQSSELSIQTSSPDTLVAYIGTCIEASILFTILIRLCIEICIWWRKGYTRIYHVKSLLSQAAGFSSLWLLGLLRRGNVQVASSYMKYCFIGVDSGPQGRCGCRRFWLKFFGLSIFFTLYLACLWLGLGFLYLKLQHLQSTVFVSDIDGWATLLPNFLGRFLDVFGHMNFEGMQQLTNSPLLVFLGFANQFVSFVSVEDIASEQLLSLLFGPGDFRRLGTHVIQIKDLYLERVMMKIWHAREMSIGSRLAAIITFGAGDLKYVCTSHPRPDSRDVFNIWLHDEAYLSRIVGPWQQLNDENLRESLETQMEALATDLLEKLQEARSQQEPAGLQRPDVTREQV